LRGPEKPKPLKVPRISLEIKNIILKLITNIITNTLLPFNIAIIKSFLT